MTHIERNVHVVRLYRRRQHAATLRMALSFFVGATIAALALLRGAL